MCCADGAARVCNKSCFAYGYGAISGAKIAMRANNTATTKPMTADEFLDNRRATVTNSPCLLILDAFPSVGATLGMVFSPLLARELCPDAGIDESIRQV